MATTHITMRAFGFGIIRSSTPRSGSNIGCGANSVAGYHLTNILLHALAACLLVAIVRGLRRPAAPLAGLLFALHPVCLEAFAWISEQKSTLSAVFYLSAALIYLRFDRDRGRPRYFLALGLFVLALLSKTVTATLPAASLIVIWWQRGRLAKDARSTCPLGSHRRGGGAFHRVGGTNLYWRARR